MTPNRKAGVCWRSGASPMPREVRLTDRATSDRNAIWLHIAEDRITAADHILDRFDEIFRLLSDNSSAGPAKPRLGKGMRTFTVEGYVICYRVSPDAVEVIAILHGARKITRRLLED
ncbi:MAG: type II toxin-antitoxin system RelE/ParE family toxin [Hyphomicrobiales bacterium]|nr:MAG: type II toxin-antitoxin system RelE/ParE family toxin [Hyphomicrobiales bacterium]